jgi:RNA polymerase sigma factor (TIGR02999 family)
LQEAKAISLVLEAIDAGRASAAEDLLPLVYADLRRVAAAKMASQPADHTLQPTELLHGAWLRISGGRQGHFATRTHFFATAAEAMRQILVDHARRKKAVRHGGQLNRTDYHEASLQRPEDEDHLLAVHEALHELALEHPLGADLVKLRFFGGLTLDEAAGVLGVSSRTADSYWAFSKSWLYRKLQSRQV